MSITPRSQYDFLNIKNHQESWFQVSVNPEKNSDKNFKFLGSTSLNTRKKYFNNFRNLNQESDSVVSICTCEYLRKFNQYAKILLLAESTRPARWAKVMNKVVKIVLHNPFKRTEMYILWQGIKNSWNLLLKLTNIDHPHVMIHIAVLKSRRQGAINCTILIVLAFKSGLSLNIS